MRALILAATVSLFHAAFPAAAQQTQNVTVRGSIESIDGDTLTVQQRNGGVAKVRLAEKTALIGLNTIAIDEIKPDAFVGVASVLQDDGSQKAVSVHIFPEALRGTNEGTRSYDVAPNSSMTNGAVAQKVVGNNGHLLTVKYREGEKKIAIDQSTSIVRFEPGAAKTDLKAGARIVVNATVAGDGAVEARRILIGLNGTVPAL